MLCDTYMVLVEKNCVASSHYHQAITKLMQLAGRSDFLAFRDAKRVCTVCQAECTRTYRELLDHKAGHGC